MEKFGKYLALLLKSKNVTKANLARKLKLKRQNYITNVVQGLHTPTLERVEQIINILNCTQEEKNKLITLAIQERQTKRNTQYIPLYPDLRIILLEYYSEKSNSYTRKKVINLLETSVFHPIEKILLQQIFTHLRKLNILIPFDNFIEYFNKLSYEGKKLRLKQAKFKWSVSSKNNIIIYEQLDDLCPNKPQYLYPPPEDYMPKFQGIRDDLIAKYSLKSNEFKKSYSPYGHEIIKEICESTYHPVEKKILLVAYKLLAQQEQSSNLLPETFFAIEKYNGREKLKEILSYWNYDSDKNILTIVFRTKTNQLLTKKFTLWNEIIK